MENICIDSKILTNDIKNGMRVKNAKERDEALTKLREIANG